VAMEPEKNNDRKKSPIILWKMKTNRKHFKNDTGFQANFAASWF